MTSPLRPVPKPPARPKKARGWNSSLAQSSKGLPRNRQPVARAARLKSHKVSKRFAKRRDPEWCAKIREECCVLFPDPSCGGRTECAHVRTRAAGAYDRGETLPLCSTHHREQHRIGIRSFEAKYGINLEALAADYERGEFR